VLIIPPASGCGYEPDVSAPERVEIERSRDWHGALLYIADEMGPNPEFGSIRVYDSVSGLVEKTVEQVKAASPSDVFVTKEGSSLFVSSAANGLIDKFRWDGNNWISGGVTLEPDASSILALRPGPDGRIYALDGTPGMSTTRLFAIDPVTGGMDQGPATTLPVERASGISWSLDGSKAFIAGHTAGTASPVLAITAWPPAQSASVVGLPVEAAHQVVTSPDGGTVYIMSRGQIIKVDPVSGTLVGSIVSSVGNVEYMDADFSADGRFLFATGNAPGANGVLYVFDLQTGAMVHSVENIGVKINGIQRVE